MSVKIEPSNILAEQEDGDLTSFESPLRTKQSVPHKLSEGLLGMESDTFLSLPLVPLYLILFLEGFCHTFIYQFGSFRRVDEGTTTLLYVEEK